MSDHTHTWPQLAAGLYNELTGRNSEISYSFEDMVIEVPSGTGEEAKHATWRLNGTLRISTKNMEDSI